MASNQLMPQGKRFMIGHATVDIDHINDSIKLALVRMSTLSNAKTITGATNATPIVITATAHGYTNGDVVLISGVGGNTAANRTGAVANQATNTFELIDADSTGSNIAGNGAYTSGGLALNLTSLSYVSDISSGIISRSGALASKVTGLTRRIATFSAANLTPAFSAVTTGAACDLIFMYKDSGSDATSPLIMLLDTATGLPATPNGGDFNITFDTGTYKIFGIN